MQPHYQTRTNVPFQGLTPCEGTRHPNFPQHSQAGQVMHRRGVDGRGGMPAWEDTEMWQTEVAVQHSVAGTSQITAQEWGHRPISLPQPGTRHSDAGTSWGGGQHWNQPRAEGTGDGAGWGSANNAQGGWDWGEGGVAVPAQGGPWQGQADPSKRFQGQANPLKQQGRGHPPRQQPSGYGRNDNTQVWG